MADLAGRMPVSTKDLQYDKRVPAVCQRQTGACLRVLLKRVQNQDLANDADTLAAAAEKWYARHNGERNHDDR